MSEIREHHIKTLDAISSDVTKFLCKRYYKMQLNWIIICIIRIRSQGPLVRSGYYYNKSHFTNELSMSSEERNSITAHSS